jgi:hypothetical protein
MRKQRFRSPDSDPFTLVECSAISISVCGSDRLSKRLLVRLNGLRHSARLYQSYDAGGGPVARERALSRIARGAGDLARRLGTLPPPDQPQHLTPAQAVLLYCLGQHLRPEWPEAAVQDGSSYERIIAALEGDDSAEADVRAAALHGLTMARAEPRRTRSERHQADMGLWLILAEAQVVFEDVTGRPARTSVNAGEADGPFIRFLAMILPKLGYTLSQKAIRAQFNRLLKSTDPFLAPHHRSVLIRT